MKNTVWRKERGDEGNTESGLMKISEAGAKRTKEEGGISRGRRGRCGRHKRYTKMPHIVTVSEQITDTKRYEYSGTAVR